MTYRNPKIFPITLPEFVLCSIGTALAMYAIGAVVGVQWVG